MSPAGREIITARQDGCTEDGAAFYALRGPHMRIILSLAASMLLLFVPQATYGQQNMPSHLHTMLSLLEQGKIVFGGLDYTFIDMLGGHDRSP